MALQKKITKEVFDKLPKALKSEYVEKDDEYILDIEGDEDTGALKRAKDREAQKRREAEKKLKEAQQELDDLQDNDAKKRGDIETLEKSWKEKDEKKDKEHQEKLAAKDKFIHSSLVDAKALEIATKIATPGNSALLLPHIKARLATDLEADTPVTKVLDSDGKVSALTVAELEQEFVANKDFASIITGSKASGSGTAGNDKLPKGGASSGDEMDLSKATGSELVERIKAKKEAQE